MWCLQERVLYAEWGTMLRAVTIQYTATLLEAYLDRDPSTGSSELTLGVILHPSQ